MTRLPDSTENNRARITEQEDKDIAREDAAEQAARFGEPTQTTDREICERFNAYLFESEEIRQDFRAAVSAGIELGRAQGRAEMKSEWNAWLAKRMEEDPIDVLLADGATWRRRHDVT